MRVVVADTGPLHYLVLVGDIARQGLVDFVAALVRLKATSFYSRRGLLEALLAQREPKKP
jgi:hypothetical protein